MLNVIALFVILLANSVLVIGSGDPIRFPEFLCLPGYHTLFVNNISHEVIFWFKFVYTSVFYLLTLTVI